MAITMTRAEYEAKYGQKPNVIPSATTSPQTTSTPISMTRAEYQAKYGVAPSVTPPVVTPPTPKFDSLVGGRVNQAKSAFTDVSNQNNDTLQAEGLKQKALSGALTGLQVAQVPVRVLGAAGGAVYDVAEPVISGAFNQIGKGIKGMQSLNPNYKPQETSPTPEIINKAIQNWNDFSQKNPELAARLGDVGNLFNLTGFGSLKSVAKNAGEDIIKGATPYVTGTVDLTKEAVTTGMEKTAKVILPSEEKRIASFNKNLNKALPVLKKDVKTLPIKQKDAFTAFNDIVANKEKIGILDNAGEIKSPTKYDFVDTVEAQKKRLPQIYSDYTKKLSTVDQAKFQEDIHNNLFNQIDNVNTQLAKENTIDGRRALTKIKDELSSLRDTSPEGIQGYIESIGQRTKVAPGHPMTTEQAKLANLGGEMRGILDNSIEKIGGAGYQDLRNTYKAHKTIESQLLQSAKSELNKTPGWTDRMANLGMTAEGINFLLTHDPHTLAIAAGIKSGTSFMKWLRSPQRALSNMYKVVEKNQTKSKPLSPSYINQSANNVPSTIIQSKVPQTPKTSKKLPVNKKK